jgi:hypothetical protein
VSQICLEGGSGDGFFGKGGSDAVLGEQADGGLVECGAELIALVRAGDVIDGSAFRRDLNDFSSVETAEIEDVPRPSEPAPAGKWCEMSDPK